MKIPFISVRPDAIERAAVPEQSYPNDAGYDLTTSRDMVIASNTFAAVPTNIALAIPDGYWGFLVARSSTFYRRGLLVNQGIIDAGYRGEVLALAYNLGEKGVVIHAGDRLVQLILVPRVADIAWDRMIELPKGIRGTKGIGSSGATGATGGNGK